MPRYLLDTNVVIAATRGEGVIAAKLGEIDAADLILSPIVLGELEFGVEKSRLKKQNRQRLQRLIQALPVAPMDAETSRQYGLIRASLESCGQPIGANDYWIAAQALALEAVLVTDNEREFRRVPGLVVENWLRV